MTAVIPNQLRLRDDVVNDGGIRDLLAQMRRRRTWLLHGAQGGRIMTISPHSASPPFRDGVRDGQFKAREVAEASTRQVAGARAQRLPGRDPRSRARRRRCSRRGARGRARRLKPLAGVPIGIKDLFATKGVATTAAARSWKASCRL
jgi:hypothetical protein